MCHTYIHCHKHTLRDKHTYELIIARCASGRYFKIIGNLFKMCMCVRARLCMCVGIQFIRGCASALRALCALITRRDRGRDVVGGGGGGVADVRWLFGRY